MRDTYRCCVNLPDRLPSRGGVRLGSLAFHVSPNEKEIKSALELLSQTFDDVSFNGTLGNLSNLFM